MSNKLTINFEKTNAILFSNSLNAQNDCSDVFFKLEETTNLNFNDYFYEKVKNLFCFEAMKSCISPSFSTLL